MANSTSKLASNASNENVLRSAHNEQDATIAVSGFVNSKIGHKVTAALSTTSVANDTVTFTFFDLTTQLYQIKIVYSSGQTLPFVSAERAT